MEGRLLEQNQLKSATQVPLLDISADLLAQIEAMRLQMNSNYQELDFKQRDGELRLVQKIKEISQPNQNISGKVSTMS